MITTGIIREVAVDRGNFIGNAYKVELNIFQIPGDNDKNNYTYVANCSTIAGLYNSYDVGDIVYVGFLNNNKSLPLILGKVYQGLEKKYSGTLQIKSLEVINNTKLSKKTQIEDITYTDLKTLFAEVEKLKNNIYYQHNITGTNTVYPLTVTFTFISKIPLFTTENIEVLATEISRLYTNLTLFGRDMDNKVYNIYAVSPQIFVAEINQAATYIELESISDTSVII